MEGKMIKNTDEFWIHHISRFEESGLTQAEYCRAHKINKSSFRSRKFSLKKKGKLANTKTEKPFFVPVEEISKSFSLSINGQFDLVFSEIPSSRWIANLIKELGDSCADSN